MQARGTTLNPKNRFERLSLDLDEDCAAERGGRRTEFLRDDAQSLITFNHSPDIPFSASANPYRGCEHGCPYCYARPFHEYLGFSAGLDFESRILVKTAAPALLRRDLASPRWVPQVVFMSGVTDCYQPVERKLEVTRRCLAVFAEFLNPVAVVTKNHLVTRDTDYLATLAAANACSVHLSITTLDGSLARKLEPRASLPQLRLEALRQLAAAGIPNGVLVAPLIPGLNDHEIPAILEAAAQAGARSASYTLLRLPYAVKEIFAAWLDVHLPDAKERILGRIRDLRQGRLNDSAFGARMRGCGDLAQHLSQFFRISAARLGLKRAIPPLSVSSFRRPNEQLELTGV